MKYPKEIIDFLNVYNIDIKIEDFTVYTVENNIIDTACITTNDGVYLQWETVGNDVYVSGEIVDICSF